MFLPKELMRHSDPDERPSAEELLRTPMCNLDPDFNFRDTQLYAQANDRHWFESIEATILADARNEVVPKPFKPADLGQPQKASDMPGVQIPPALSLGDDSDVDEDPAQSKQQVPDFDVVDDLLHRWTTIAV